MEQKRFIDIQLVISNENTKLIEEMMDNMNIENIIREKETFF